MPENITAKDLMRLSFLRLGAAHTLREALGILLDPQSRDKGARALIVLHPDGSFAGTLTARFLLRALLPEWVTEEEAKENETAFERKLLEAMQKNLELQIGDAMNRDVPTVTPDERLPRLIEIMRNKRLDCLPVLDKDRVVGVIYITDVFNTAAQLALAAQTEEKKRA